MRFGFPERVARRWVGVIQLLGTGRLPKSNKDLQYNGRDAGYVTSRSAVEAAACHDMRGGRHMASLSPCVLNGPTSPTTTFPFGQLDWSYPVPSARVHNVTCAFIQSLTEQQPCLGPAAAMHLQRQHSRRRLFRRGFGTLKACIPWRVKPQGFDQVLNRGYEAQIDRRSAQSHHEMFLIAHDLLSGRVVTYLYPKSVTSFCGR